MRIASAYIDITPENEFYLVGYFNEARSFPAAGVHDTPYCVGLLLEEDDVQILFLSLDVCVITRNKMEPVKVLIEKKTGIPKENIIMNSIHSHSCPNGLDDSDIANHKNEKYYQLVKQKCAELATGLSKHLMPATAEIGKIWIEGFYGNRNNPEEKADLTAYRIIFKDDSQKMTGQILNLNCHSTVLGNQNMELSTDLLGNIRQKLFEQDGIMPYVINGASADISNRNFRKGNDYAELNRVAEGVSSQLLSIRDYELLSFKNLSIKQAEYTVQYDNTVNFSKLLELKKELEMELQQEITADEYKLKESELLMVNVKLSHPEIYREVKCNIISADDFTIVTFPGELANRFSTQLKNTSKKKYLFMICYADDYLGYFMNQEMYGKCYECTASYLPKGETEKIIQKLETYL